MQIQIVAPKSIQNVNGVPFLQFSVYAKNMLFANCETSDICTINLMFFELVLYIVFGEGD